MLTNSPSKIRGGKGALTKPLITNTSAQNITLIDSPSKIRGGKGALIMMSRTRRLN